MRSLDPLYKGIRLKPFEAIRKGGADFFPRVSCAIWNGLGVKFCHGPWCNEDPTKHHLWELFNMMAQKDVWIGIVGMVIVGT
ncbi:hypothetical protein AAG906_013694 [Vitis piasezkii]